ncbi:MAG: dihydroorotate dehydrogenase electron transfer subunit, partial [Termitinemataceae bacterium]
YLAIRLPAGTYDFYAGFRSRSYGLDGLTAGTTVIASEDGSSGRRGLIPDFFDPVQYQRVYACGPLPMLRAITRKCEAAAVPCHISLEERMACGVGACLGCSIRTVHGNRRCCADGPIFDAQEVLFDE